uniref:DDE Tnp4 domain-containing protein n=1 Tax=Anopheles merus TaxID=30066 RepID=A0A182UMB0_ANOME
MPAASEEMSDEIFPSSEAGWQRVSEAFQDRWQFPHAIGVIDARHVKIRKPLHTDKDYLNYKGFYSIVLLGIVDASANFMYVCVGGKGSIADGGMLRNASYHSKFEHHELNVPPPAVLDERHAERLKFSCKSYQLRRCTTVHAGPPVANSQYRRLKSRRASFSSTSAKVYTPLKRFSSW